MNALRYYILLLLCCMDPQLSCDSRPFASVPQLFNKLSRKSDPHQNIIAQIIQFLPPRRAHTVLEATLFLQKFPETRNRNRYLFSGKISETRAQGKSYRYHGSTVHRGYNLCCRTGSLYRCRNASFGRLQSSTTAFRWRHEWVLVKATT